MMRLLMILLASLVLSSCATTKEFAYQIERPVCEEYEIVKWCMTGWEDFIPVYADEECPEDGMIYSVETEIDCFRKIDHYISEMELRIDSGIP